MGRLAVEMAFGVLWAPHHAFRQFGRPGVLALCVGLFLARWLVTPLTTVRNLYLYQSPILLPLPLGSDVQAYRFWEQVWYAPYGLAFMLAIVWAVVAFARRLGIGARFRDVFELMAVAYFTPWAFSAAADCVIIPAGWIMPYSMVVIHLAALGWSSALLAVGLAERYHLAPGPALRLSALAGALFLIFGAVVMR